MTTFKVGEIAIGRNFTKHLSRNQLECEIIEPLKPRVLRYYDGSEEFAMAHKVLWPDGYMDYQPLKRLAKKRPPESDESAARQAMLDCIERAKMPVEVPA